LRRHRLIFLLAPGLAWSHIAFALDVNVGGTAGACDPANDTTCDTTSLVDAINWVNSSGSTSTITIDAASYAPPTTGRFADASEDDLPSLTVPTTVTSTESTLDSIGFVVNALRAKDVDLTVSNLVVRSADADSGDGGEFSYSGIDVDNGNLTGTNLRFLDGGPFGSQDAPGRYGVHGIFVREGNATLTDIDINANARGGGVYFQDDQVPSVGHDLSILGTSNISNIKNGPFHVGHGPGSAIDASGFASVTIGGTATFANDSYSSGDPAVSLYRGGSTTIDGATFDNGLSDSGVLLQIGGSLAVTNSTFTNNDGISLAYGGEATAGYAPTGQVSIDGTVFDHNYNSAEGFGGGAVSIYGAEGGVNASITSSTFSNNTQGGGYGGEAADLAYKGLGHLEVENTMFTDFNGDSTRIQGEARFVDSTWTTQYGGEGAMGGAVFEVGGSDLTVQGCTFDHVYGAEGGAVYVSSSVPYNYGSVDTFATFMDTDFNDVQATSDGGEIFVEEGATVTLHSTSFTNAMAPRGGAIAVGPWYGDSMQPGQVYGDDVSFRNTAALSGGAIYLYQGSMASFTGGSFTNSTADMGATPFLPDGPEGYGGAVVAVSSSLEFHGTTFTDNHAAEWGGVVFSGDPWQAYYNESWGDVGPFGSYCASANYGRANVRSAAIGGPGGYGGSVIVLDGVTDSGATAGGAAVAYFGHFDQVTIEASTFTGDQAGAGFYGTPDYGGPPYGAFLVDSVSSFDMSCSTICSDTGAAVASAIGWFDDGAVGGAGGGELQVKNPKESEVSARKGAHQETAPRTGQLVGATTGNLPVPTKDIRGTIRNNTFQNIADGGEGYGSTVALWFCDLSDGGGYFNQGGDTADTGVWDTSFPPNRDTGVWDTSPPNPDTIPHLTNARGQVSIVNNTFVGNDGAQGLVSASTGDVRTDLRNNILQDGAIGLMLDPYSRFLTGDYNLYDNLGANVVGATMFPAANSVSGAPAFRDYTPGTCFGELYLDPGTPGYDQGDPALADWDGSRSNIGAFGGPDACTPDADGDGANAIVDCNEADPTISPNQADTPYDGIDQNCDGSDLYDVDGDTYLADNAACGGDDCNDADPNIHPGAVDTPYDGIDQDCSGYDACDNDGDGSNALACGGLDCNDDDATIYPGAPEIPDDGIDQNCDGSDLQCDVDGDGVKNTACGGFDCNDDDATIYPGATEVPYDGIDQDCTGTDLCDVDCDGYLAPECGGDDCDDTDPATHPGAVDNPLDNIDQTAMAMPRPCGPRAAVAARRPRRRPSVGCG